MNKRSDFSILTLDTSSPTRYQFARGKVLDAATPVGQVDFVETLDLCLQAAIESGEITTSRAVEMFGRFEHFCDVLGGRYRARE